MNYGTIFVDRLKGFDSEPCLIHCLGHYHITQFRVVNGNEYTVRV
jgi:hypothetical protein